MVTSLTLLLVDSDPGERQTLTALLEPAGFVVAAVSTQGEALGRLGEKPSVELVLLGPTLPCRGELIGALRTSQAASRLPMIALLPASDEGNDERVGHLFAAGADDVVRRSAGPVELVARVRARLRASARSSPAPGGSHPYVHLLENAADGIAVIDYEGRAVRQRARARPDGGEQAGRGGAGAAFPHVRGRLDG